MEFITVKTIEETWEEHPHANERHMFVIKDDEHITLKNWGINSLSSLKELLTKVSWDALVTFNKNIVIYVNHKNVIYIDYIANSIMELAIRYGLGINWEARLPVLKYKLIGERMSKK